MRTDRAAHARDGPATAHNSSLALGNFGCRPAPASRAALQDIVRQAMGFAQDIVAKGTEMVGQAIDAAQQLATAEGMPIVPTVPGAIRSPTRRRPRSGFDRGWSEWCGRSRCGAQFAEECHRNVETVPRASATETVSATRAGLASTQQTEWRRWMFTGAPTKRFPDRAGPVTSGGSRGRYSRGQAAGLAGILSR